MKQVLLSSFYKWEDQDTEGSGPHSHKHGAGRIWVKHFCHQTLHCPLHLVRATNINFVTKGWTWLIIQVDSVFCLEIIRRRIGNQGWPKWDKSLACRGRDSSIAGSVLLAALGVALWARLDGDLGCSRPSSFCFVVPQLCLGGPVFLPRTASPIDHEIPPFSCHLLTQREHTAPPGYGFLLSSPPKCKLYTNI